MADIVRISKNFALSEMVKSATAERLGVDNSPSLIHLVNLTHLAIHILQPVRDKFGVITINSGYRSPALNAKVGGSKTSQHCNGQAGDFESFSTANPDLARWIAKNLDFDQLILEFYDGKDPNSGWIHCSYNLMGNRGVTLTALKTSGKVVYKKGLLT
jgi:zinc D-Ala-D-Ala carboxypeptidase